VAASAKCGHTVVELFWLIHKRNPVLTSGHRRRIYGHMPIVRAQKTLVGKCSAPSRALPGCPGEQCVLYAFLHKGATTMPL
jgi:hypothetical protein